MKVLTYVLHGAWNTPDADGVIVIDVSERIEPLLEKLNQIADSKAREYVEMYGYVSEERGERYYEAVNVSGKYAKFYITEHWIELSKNIMGEISREMEKIDRSNDIGQYLDDMYEDGNLEAWKYEYMTRKPDATKSILQDFERMEDCNISYNATMENVVDAAIEKLSLDDKKLEFLWEEFGDVLVDDDECILDDFLGFECGTHREEIWHWFDERHSKGVAFLMYG